jgi:hypothetical protein
LIYASFLNNFTKIAVAVTYDEDVSGKDADLEWIFARDQLLFYASDDGPLLTHFSRFSP